MMRAPSGTVSSDATPEPTVAAMVQQSGIHHRRSVRFVAIVLLGTVLFSLFTALGTWQLKRRAWKHALIQRVEQRVHAPAVDAPGQDRWPHITAESDEYRHIRVTGTLLSQFTSRVQAVTDLGSGFWLMTPLLCADGSTILINRGFVPATAADYRNTTHAAPTAVPASVVPASTATTATTATISITGLLRISEPKGGFLRANDPAADRWFSRDVAAMAAAHQLTRSAPYFIDADATPDAGVTNNLSASGKLTEADHPVGGLTVIRFNDSHMVYTLTWYALALMTAGACFWVARAERTLLRRDIDAGINVCDQESHHATSD